MKFKIGEYVAYVQSLSPFIFQGEVERVDGPIAWVRVEESEPSGLIGQVIHVPVESLQHRPHPPAKPLKEISGKSQKKGNGYTEVRDQFGNRYVVPFDKLPDFERWDQSDTICFPEWAIAIGKYEQVVFRSYRIEGEREE